MSVSGLAREYLACLIITQEFNSSNPDAFPDGNLFRVSTISPCVMGVKKSEFEHLAPRNVSTGVLHNGSLLARLLPNLTILCDNGVFSFKVISQLRRPIKLKFVILNFGFEQRVD